MRFESLETRRLMAVNIDASAGLTSSENGDQTTFEIALDSPPILPVTVHLASSNLAEGVVDKPSLVFDLLNWANPQRVTVTGVDDFFDDGDVHFEVRTSIDTLDPIYQNAIAPTVTITNLDNDSAGISTTYSGTVTEAGGHSVLEVELDSQPTGRVMLNLSLGDSDEASLSTEVLVFDAANWSTPQGVVVTGRNDWVSDGDVNFDVSLSATSADDSTYDAMIGPSVGFSNLDDDYAGIIVDLVGGPHLNELDGQTQIQVVLTSEPTQAVSVNLSLSGSDQALLSATHVLFDATNWNTPQTVTVTSIDNYVHDGDVQFDVQFDVESFDNDYDSTAIPSLLLTVIDDDEAGISMSPSGDSTVDGSGDSTEFEVVLRSEPTGRVTINLVSSVERGEVTSSNATFDATNWYLPQIVTVTIDDNADGGSDSTSVLRLIASSDADPRYDGLVGPIFGIFNVDDGILNAVTPKDEDSVYHGRNGPSVEVITVDVDTTSPIIHPSGSPPSGESTSGDLQSTGDDSGETGDSGANLASDTIDFSQQEADISTSSVDNDSTVNEPGPEPTGPAFDFETGKRRIADSQPRRRDRRESDVGLPPKEPSDLHLGEPSHSINFLKTGGLRLLSDIDSSRFRKDRNRKADANDTKWRYENLPSNEHAAPVPASEIQEPEVAASHAAAGNSGQPIEPLVDFIMSQIAYLVDWEGSGKNIDQEIAEQSAFDEVAFIHALREIEYETNSPANWISGSHIPITAVSIGVIAWTIQSVGFLSTSISASASWRAYDPITLLGGNRKLNRRRRLPKKDDGENLQTLAAGLQEREPEIGCLSGGEKWTT